MVSRGPYCVKATVLDALKDYKVIVLQDATNHRYNHEKSAINTMRDAGAIVADSEDFLTCLKLCRIVPL